MDSSVWRQYPRGCGWRSCDDLHPLWWPEWHPSSGHPPQVSSSWQLSQVRAECATSATFPRRSSRVCRCRWRQPAPPGSRQTWWLSLIIFCVGEERRGVTCDRGGERGGRPDRSREWRQSECWWRLLGRKVQAAGAAWKSSSASSHSQPPPAGCGSSQGLSPSSSVTGGGASCRQQSQGPPQQSRGRYTWLIQIELIFFMIG